MSHFRLISRTAQGVALLPQLAAEGNKVDFWAASPLAKNVYHGMIDQVNDWSDGLNQETIVLFDAAGSGSVAEKIKDAGYQVFGAGKFNDVMEYDMEFALRIARAHGLRVPDWRKFETSEEAIDFLSQANKPWTMPGYDNYTNAELMKVMAYYRPENFLLTEHIEGPEVWIEAWYLDGELVPNSLNSSIEKTGNVLAWWWPPKKPNKQKRHEYTEATLYRHTLKKLEPFLKNNRLSGPLSARCLISRADGLPYTLGFRSGFGFPKLYALLEGLNGQPLGELLESLASGTMTELKPVYNEWCAAASCSSRSCFANHLILGVEDLEHLRPIDVQVKDERLLTAGAGGAALYVTGRNKNIQLGSEIFKRIDRIKIPDKQDGHTGFFYRAEKTVRLLKKWRYF